MYNNEISSNYFFFVSLITDKVDILKLNFYLGWSTIVLYQEN